MKRTEIKDREVENPAIIVEYKNGYQTCAVPCEWMTVDDDGEKPIGCLWSTLSWTKVVTDEEGNTSEINTGVQAIIAKFPLDQLIGVSQVI